MAELIYSAIASLDGYVADEHGKWDWSMPDPEVHAFVNDLERPVGTHLYGRRMYEVLVAWETMDDPDPLMRDFAEIWRGGREDRLLEHARAGLQRAHADRAHASTPTPCASSSAPPSGTSRSAARTLAAEAFAAGLVDRVHLFLSPVIVGGGTRALPDGVRLDLELVDERRFGNGAVHLAYRRLSRSG